VAIANKALLLNALAKGVNRHARKFGGGRPFPLAPISGTQESIKSSLSCLRLDILRNVPRDSEAVLNRDQKIDARVLRELKHGVDRHLRDSGRIYESDDQRIVTEAQLSPVGGLNPILSNHSNEIMLRMFGQPPFQRIGKLDIIFDENELVKGVFQRDKRRAREFFSPTPTQYRMSRISRSHFPPRLPAGIRAPERVPGVFI
jgi:hypothetical protein